MYCWFLRKNAGGVCIMLYRPGEDGFGDTNTRVPTHSGELTAHIIPGPPQTKPSPVYVEGVVLKEYFREISNDCFGVIAHQITELLQ